MFFRSFFTANRALRSIAPVGLFSLYCHAEDPGCPRFDHGTRYDPRYFMSDAAAKVAPSVVRIISHHRPTHPADDDDEYPTQHSGSGFVVAWQGQHFIVTNAHTIPNIDNNPTDVKAILPSGIAVPVRVKAFDTKTDLAVLTCPSAEAPAADLGMSTSLRPGECIVAIGAPLNLGSSVTHGVVSALHRTATDIGLDNDWSSGFDYIQVDATIHEGNSGGPLVNCDGQVVGLNAMTTTYGVSWALPIEDVMEIVNSLLTNGFVSRPFLGIQMKTLTAAVIEGLAQVLKNFPEGLSHGVIITVNKGTPASRAGLRNGDVIVSINGQPVLSDRDVVKTLIRTGTAKVDVEVARVQWQGKTKKTVYSTITLRPTPYDVPPPPTNAH